MKSNLVLSRQSSFYFTVGISVAVAAAVLAFWRSNRSKTEIIERSLDDIPLEPILLYDCKNLVGEGLFWDVKTQSLYWVDIEGKKLYCLKYKTRQVISFNLPKRASAVYLRKCAEDIDRGLPFLIAFEDGFAFYNPENGATVYLCGDYKQNGNVRLNDGFCDRQGRFICGGINLENIDEPLDVWEPTMQAYQIGADLEPKLFLNGPFRCYNGTCFSPDGKTMYMTDTPTKKILKYDYDPATGKIESAPRVFTEIRDAGCPDGATVDAFGNVWVAEFWAGRIAVYNSDGDLFRTILISKALRTTNCCIGGPNLDILFITSASIGLNEEELKVQSWAGGLIAMKLKSSVGLEESRFSF